jgi:Co/Zn/Cd efflux system component
MADCCEDKACAIDALKLRQGATLKTVLWLNAVMFVVELGAGIFASSSSLMSDALDNLGDALTYGLSLYSVSRGDRAKAKVALFKGALILSAGVAVLAQIAYRMLHPAVPTFEVMGGISVLAFVSNGLCLALLWKHREDDINMSSVWECSRNDVAANLAVLLAAGGVWLTNAAWPDILLGLLLALLFLRSATRVIRSALAALRTSIRPISKVAIAKVSFHKTPNDAKGL